MKSQLERAYDKDQAIRFKQANLNAERIGRRRRYEQLLAAKYGADNLIHRLEQDRQLRSMGSTAGTTAVNRYSAPWARR